jgi:transposase
MARKRRTYTPEFKAEAVKLVTDQGYSVAEAARSLSIGEALLRSWKQALDTQGDRAFPATASSLPPRRNCAACAPRTSGCGRSATS